MRHLRYFAFTLGLASVSTADMFKPSFKQQLELGKKAAAELRQKNKILPAIDLRVKTLKEVGSRLIALIDAKEKKQKPYEWSFDVIESKEVNAFALPGGPVFFYTGLLDRMKTVDELAGVLGHEMTHVRQEHWANAYADSQKRNLLLTGILIIARANSNAVDIASISNSLLFDLPFSRGMESKADAGGFQALNDAGYNPKGMIDVFTMLSKVAGSGGTPEFLKDHPDDKNRIKNIQKMIDDATKKGKVYPPMKLLPFAPRIPEAESTSSKPKTSKVRG